MHLLKCEKSAPRKATCPFNASHRISEADRAAHISTCPDKAYVERTLLATSKSNVQKVPPYESELPEPTENWEAECNPLPIAGYDPTAHMNELTFRNAPTLASLTKSQKKQFYNSLNSNQSSAAGGSSSASTCEDSSVNQLTPLLKQLRLPKEEAMVEKAKQPPNRSLGLGRGHSRLAANIFQSNSCNTSISEPNSLNSDRISNFMAIARGRGMGRPMPSSSLPKVGRKENIAPKTEIEDSEETTNGSGTSTPSLEGSQTDELQPEKLKRRLQKKLRQIAMLEAQQEAGRRLNQEELEKISKKFEIEQQLKDLDM